MWHNSPNIHRSWVFQAQPQAEGTLGRSSANLSKPFSVATLTTLRKRRDIAKRAGNCVQRAKRSGEKLSKATLNAPLAHLKRFFQWLAGQPGYKSRLQYSDADYFNLPGKDVRVARARREQVVHVIRFATTFGRLLKTPAFGISIPTVSGIGFSVLGRKSARHPRSSRPGVRTSGIRRY